MKKNILVLTGSPRRKGNSDMLADAFIEGAKEAGHQVTKIETARKKISGCIACNTCFSKGKACSIDNNFNEIAPSIEQADMLVLCTPLYWFSFSTQIKAAIDKLYSFMVGGKPLKIKESLLLVCAETDNMEDFDGIKRSYELIVNYMKWQDKGQLLIPNINKVGDIFHTDALETAKELGRKM
jgi:multimeric flavodoxin WrbA